METGQPNAATIYLLPIAYSKCGKPNHFFKKFLVLFVVEDFSPHYHKLNISCHQFSFENLTFNVIIFHHKDVPVFILFDLILGCFTNIMV